MPTAGVLTHLSREEPLRAHLNSCDRQKARERQVVVPVGDAKVIHVVISTVQVNREVTESILTSFYHHEACVFKNARDCQSIELLVCNDGSCIPHTRGLSPLQRSQNQKGSPVVLETLARFTNPVDVGSRQTQNCSKRRRREACRLFVNVPLCRSQKSFGD
ncbi:hypothetical protein E1301_Tti013538 [Triplophysa tibetana]|uniref:Uncharacterized protein n=1 Tax=Triplophysa tibetana TaxID=1572043 RepID=A0A5A9NSQ6_9TELE|nr:hypothetical protein E1301_Tti013538 [Triplophysa tibetana]